MDESVYSAVHAPSRGRLFISLKFN